MKQFWTYALNIAGGLLLLLAAIGLLGLAAPFLTESLGRIGAEMDTERGQSGLIYVESPEVYTRQRLVNDRYLQDAWLRGKLEEIDSAETVWIDTIRLSRREATVALGAGDIAEAGNDADDSALGDLSQMRLSFENQFDLQANARDEIRQMILENALDDRHDLTGNTVYGLKFDTSVLPGSRATESPTIIVNMDANPLDRLNQAWRPQDLAGYYVRDWSADPKDAATGVDPACDIQDYACAVTVLQQMDSHFEAWRKNIEDRLNDQRARESKVCTPLESGPGGSEAQRAATLAVNLCGPQPLVSDTGATAAVALAPTAIANIQAVLDQRGALDRAVSFVMRIPDRKVAVGGMYLEKMTEQARTQCNQPAATGQPSLQLGALFADGAFSTATKVFDLPTPWAPLFQFQVQPRLPEEPTTCGYELDIQLNPLDVPLFFIPARWVSGDAPAGLAPISGNLFNAGLDPLPCGAQGCIDGLTVWTQRNRAEAARLAIDDATLASLIDGLDRFDEAGRLCFGPDYYFRPLPDEIDPETGQLFVDADAPPSDIVCGGGHLLTFHSGAYHFFRRMAQVETYTYAAFPRGDVSGVVTETVSQQEAGARYAGALGGIATQFGTQDRDRTATAEPHIINFAAGDDHELFDFGWAIVKDGVKEPMLASQLVLIAVPAYLTEIRLDIIKGFLDADNVDRDWRALRADYDSAQKPLSDSDRDALLATRVERLFSGYERRTIRLKVPPDYDALDGVVVGNSVTTGPSINKTELADKDCFRYFEGRDFSLAIPGERLWRSTVVTLGGQKADRIEVMPDMKGILATFANFSPAFSQNLFRSMAQVIVWTSEGNDPIDIPLCNARPTQP